MARSGALFTDLRAVTHPSQPNYLALFSGSTQGLRDDSCPHSYTSDNLAAQLHRAGLTFVGYSEGLPARGSRVCTAGAYARKHAPWVNFPGLPVSTDLPLGSFPADYARLPSLSFVIPDLDHDMHDGTITQADSWLRQRLDGYRRWAVTHHSLLVVTWDEDDHTEANRIPTIVTGAGVRPGRYGEHADLYRLLRTLQWLFGLPGLGASARRTPVTDIWYR